MAATCKTNFTMEAKLCALYLTGHIDDSLE